VDNAVSVSYGAAHHKKAKSARRIAVLIDGNGRIAQIYDPAGTGDFPAKVLADIKKDEL
jgi:peroxiredoxin